MTTVACVLRSGGIYGPEWVHRLRDGVGAHTSLPHRFVCLSDALVPSVETMPLQHEWPGWWSKAELFRPGLFHGRVVYLDLDMVVVGVLDPLLAYRGPFVALRDWIRGDPVRSSAAMSWDGDEPPPIYEAMREDPPVFRGRSDYWWNDIADAGALQDAFPDMFGSYKVHGLKRSPGPHSVVDFHGDPKPNATDSEWVEEAWLGVGCAT